MDASVAINHSPTPFLCLRRVMRGVLGANSTLIRNAVEDLFGEDFEGRFESKYLARTILEGRLKFQVQH
ncbi:hypothetical protein, partial [Xanthomonas oryzae]